MPITRKSIHNFFRFVFRFAGTYHKIKTDHPLLLKIQGKKEIVFVWVPGHVGLLGNETADWAAKEALDKEPTVDLMPFSDPKPMTAKYIHQVWQKEWDESVRESFYAKKGDGSN